jgi:hypothetical protein
MPCQRGPVIDREDGSGTTDGGADLVVDVRFRHTRQGGSGRDYWSLREERRMSPGPGVLGYGHRGIRARGVGNRAVAVTGLAA